jgi:hypothetical protein
VDKRTLGGGVIKSERKREEKRGKEDEWGAAKTRVCHALPMA